MKYPFSPELLDALPEELAELFRGLELKLLEEICSRLKITDQLNEVTVQDIRALRSHGIDLENIKKAIRETTETGEEKLDKLLDDVVARNQRYYTDMIDLAGVTAPERLVSEADIAAIRRQTWGAYKNITGSMGFLTVQGGRLVISEPAKAYERCLDNALMQIQSGAISYNQAISEQVKTLANRGLCVAFDKNGNPVKNVVKYEKGGIQQLDVCVRRAVMTGVNQLNQKYREQSMDYLETDLVEVTAHLGARNTDGPNGWENHAKWQGKVYRWRKDGVGYAVPDRKTAPKPTPTPPTPIQTAVPAPVQPAPRAALTPVDVTQEYLDSATPGIGSVTYEEGYRTKGHQNEIKMAQWLLKTFGGDVKLLKESDIKGQTRPDYLWNQKLWELKGASSINGADKLLQHAIKQIQNNPGGVILNALETMDMEALEQQLIRRLKRSSVSIIDLMILSKGDLFKILKYKK